MRHARLWLCLVLALAGLLTACGGNSIQIQSHPQNVTKTIQAADGGTLTNSGGATLTIPPNVLSEDAKVTLADTGPQAHVKADPLGYISDGFSVTATPLNGNTPVKLLSPAKLDINTHPDKNAKVLDQIIAEVTNDDTSIIHLHPSDKTDGKNTVISKYASLGAVDWGVLVPQAPQPTETDVLQVPWYDQSGLPWCVPTSLTEMLRYYDFAENSGDPLNATFGQSTALANWQTAGQSHQPAGSGAGYDETTNIGVQNYNHSDPGTGARVVTYLWDDDFFFNPPGDNQASQDLNYLDFEAYVVLVNTGIFGLIDRRPLAMLVDTWWHSIVIVGVDGTGLFLHNSNGGIAYHMNWTDLANQARAYRTDDQGKPYEVHTIWTGVAYDLPVKPQEKRQGSVVIARGDVSFTDAGANPVTLDWDGAGAHTYGYFFNDSANPSGNASTLGTYAFRNSPLNYRYRVANVTNVPLTFHTVAELSGATYGSGMVSQSHDVTVQPYSVSDYITGTFSTLPSGSNGIFDVRLVEVNNQSINQDVKIVRFDIRDASGPPIVNITSPINGIHVRAGIPFTLSGSVSDPTGQNIPDSRVMWSADDTQLGTGRTLTTSLAQPGTYTITLAATNGLGQQGSAHITLTVDPASPKPSVSITAPPNGQAYYNTTGNGTSVTLTGVGSSGVTKFAWSDSLQGTLGSGASITVTLYAQNVGNCAPPTSHTITLTGTDNNNQSASASITVTLYNVCIQ